MAFLEFIGAAILIIAILIVAFWVGLREQGFLRNISRRSQANAIAARELADRHPAQQQYGPPPGQYGPAQEYGGPQSYGPPPGYQPPPPGYQPPQNPEDRLR